MTSDDEYLKKLLNEQEPSDGLKIMLRNERKKIESFIRDEVSESNVRFYYAGSYKKETMIEEIFDLDIVIYYPNDTSLTLREIYYKIQKILQRNDYAPREKNVALQCNRIHKTYGEFHVDVVPGRAIDDEYYYAKLYKSKEDSSLQTSVTEHVEAVRGTRHRDIIKLLKLWKIRRGFSCPTFILEMLFLRFIDTNHGRTGLFSLLMGTFNYIAQNIQSIRLVDPANSNNIVSNDLSDNQKYQIYRHAQKAYKTDSWADVF
ncbi:MAG: hypothetical protein HeimC3_31900 [Candidatus Heimdallarchaeota archaeon LC_3]|nr:MAG: hypothetical protein HeimC3_31900 [Candidatus Heimdallarchaeota archaeon LC_3]